MNYILIIIGAMLFAYLILRLTQKPSTKSKRFNNLDIFEAQKLLNENKVSTLDVRTPFEVKQGKINDATVINYASPLFSKEIDKLDKSSTFLVYCRSGNRSAQACRIMADKGFLKLYNLSGGYNAWNK